MRRCIKHTCSHATLHTRNPTAMEQSDSLSWPLEGSFYLLAMLLVVSSPPAPVQAGEN